MKKDIVFNRKIIGKLAIFATSLIVGGFIGYILAFSIRRLPFNYKPIPTYASLLTFIVAYVFIIAIHELGHFICFVKNGIKMRALFITIFLFIREEGSWRIKIRPNNITAFGGVAIPEVMPVKNEEALNSLQQAYARAIIAGPISSVIAWFVISLITIPILLSEANLYLNSFLIILLITTTAVTIFIIIASFIKNEVAVGDFPAYTLAKKDKFFVAMQLYQYTLFSSNPMEYRSKNGYLRGVILKELEKKLQNKDNHIYTINIIDTLIVEHLVGVADMPTIVIDYLYFLLEDKTRLNHIKGTDVSNTFIFHSIMLLYKKQDTKEKAIDLYKEKMKTINKKGPIEKYLLKQIEHFLGISDNGEYLKDKNNIRISIAHGLWKNFEGYYMDEISLNRQQIANLNNE